MNKGTRSAMAAVDSRSCWRPAGATARRVYRLGEEGARRSRAATGTRQREARRAQALADPANYRRYLLDAQDLAWWEAEGRRAREAVASHP